MWRGLLLLTLSILRAIRGEEYAINEFGESSVVLQQHSQVTNDNGDDEHNLSPEDLFEISKESSQNLLETSFPNLIRVTPSNYLEIFHQQVFSIVLIYDELTANVEGENGILKTFISVAGDDSLRSEKTQPQFLYLNARSDHCHSLIGDQNHEGIWHVRRSYYEEETIYPTCYEEGKEFTPQLWLLYWRDSHLMSPLRLSSPLFQDGEQPSTSISSITAKMLTDSISNLIAMDLTYVTAGNPAIHEPSETSIIDIHSFTGVYQRSIVNSASGIIILAIYDRGGYSHPLHPVDQSIAPPHIINASENLLEIFSQAVQIIRREANQKHAKDEFGYTVFFRLDRMEEKNYQQLDTLHRLKLTPEDLPAVLMLKDGTPFERIPYVFPTKFLSDPVQLAEKISSAVLRTEGLYSESSVAERLRKEEELHHREVIDASKLSPEELKKFLKITPQR